MVALRPLIQSRVPAMQPFCQLMTHYVITFQLADVQLMMAGADGESMNTITVCHNNAIYSNNQDFKLSLTVHSLDNVFVYCVHCTHQSPP